MPGSGFILQLLIHQAHSEKGQSEPKWIQLTSPQKHGCIKGGQLVKGSLCLKRVSLPYHHYLVPSSQLIHSHNKRWIRVAMFSYLLTQSLIHLIHTFPRIGIQVEHDSVTETCLGGTHFPLNNPEIIWTPPSTIRHDNVKLYHNISNPQNSWHVMPSFSSDLPLKATIFNRVSNRVSPCPWIPPTLEAAMPHPGAHHRGLWPFSHGKLQGNPKMFNVENCETSAFEGNQSFTATSHLTGFMMFWCELRFNCEWLMMM